MNPVAMSDGFEKALAFGGATHSLGDLLDAVMHGRARIWETENAAIVTEVHEMPQKRTIHFWVATGDMAEVVELSHIVLDWARENNFDGATLAGRKGWQRVLAAEGWEPTITILTKEL